VNDQDQRNARRRELHFKITNALSELLTLELEAPQPTSASGMVRQVNSAVQYRVEHLRAIRRSVEDCLITPPPVNDSWKAVTGNHFYRGVPRDD
jgi:hypothetical protein